MSMKRTRHRKDRRAIDYWFDQHGDHGLVPVTHKDWLQCPIHYCEISYLWLFNSRWLRFTR